MAVTTIEGAIQEALFTRMASLVLSPAHPVSWPNLNFTKPANNRYLEARFIPNTVTRQFIGSTDPHQRQGFLQINVRDGLNQNPRIVETAGLVAAHFHTDLRLHHATGISVRISSAPQVGSMLVEDTPPGALVPVLVPFDCWA